ncbi:hypothetical protein LJB90_02435, partial [Eubacteriales bacterium OttesenSCG-928-G02]|nr:hypothetical protein [Eubacteriales bacterium OttesenSCG-928-G02]
TVLLGLLAIFIEAIYSKYSKKNRENRSYNIRIFISILIPGIIVTTLNTIFLRYVTYAGTWAGQAFVIVWVPRVIEEIIVLVIQAFFISIIYDLFVRDKQFNILVQKKLDK